MRKQLYIGLMVVAMASVYSVALPQGRKSVNRVRPPRNTEQYRKEADRVHLEKLTDILGLTEAQKEKFNKENAERQKKEKKQEERLNKERCRWDNAQKENAEAKEKILADYDAHLKKILTPEQYLAYREWLLTNVSPECDNDSTAPVPGPGPLVKGPEPVLLTE